MSRVLSHTILNSPLGKLRLLSDEKAIYWLSFAESEKSEQAFTRFLKKHAIKMRDEKSKLAMASEEALRAYFQGELTSFHIRLNPLGTAFQQKVWQALTRIPHGQTQSYKTLATQLGNAKASRAVALANAANPICIFIPCHRVVQHDGQVGGYSGGVTQKIALLVGEGNVTTRKRP